MSDSSSKVPAANQGKARPAAASRGPSARRSGLRALAATLPKVARRALGRRGFADAGLIADWPAIVGQTIAERCHPMRLSFPRAKERKDGSLLLKVEPGFALELQHLEPLLLERINGHFGYPAVARLKFHQAPLDGRGPARPQPDAPLPAEEAQLLSARLRGVADDELRACLERLARSFHAKQRP